MLRALSDILYIKKLNHYCRVEEAPPNYEDLYKPPTAEKNGSGYSSFGVSVEAGKNASDKPTNK